VTEKATHERVLPALAFTALKDIAVLYAGCGKSAENSAENNLSEKSAIEHGLLMHKL
jgi:hypothetical protein